jgi:hypothetical protein
VGYRALYLNTDGQGSTAVGYRSLNSSTGYRNTALGERSGYGTTSGKYNTAIGASALRSNSTGDSNIALGYKAGINATTGDDNILIGNLGVAAESDTIRIGTSQTKAFVAGIHGVTTDVAGAVAVMIDSAGQLGTVSSSRRYKEDIHDLGTVSSALMKLRPVLFRYRQAMANGETPLQIGLIAEEVAEVMPELVVFDEQGRPETVKYHLLSTLLLSELQSQNERIEALERRMEALLPEVKTAARDVGGRASP